MRSKIIIFIAICLWTSTSLGQLSPSQIELIDKYKSTRRTSSDDEVERYSNPDIYGQPSANRKETSAIRSAEQNNNTPADTLKSEPAKLRPFGYDIFQSSAEGFLPGVYDLPPGGYTFGPGDNIIVNVWGTIDLSLELVVDREGGVFIPKIGEIVAAGSTLEQFRQKLDKKLREGYSDYQLSVSYGRLRQISIYVFGEVDKPGGYTISSLANILHAIYMAGGITENGSLRNIQLIRNTHVLHHYDFYNLLLKGDNADDLKLLSGDVVYVPVVGSQVEVDGEVRRPAIYELTGTERISDALMLAGGATPEAFLESVSLDRVGPNDSRILKNLNLSDSAAAADDDVSLQDGDRIAVYSIYDFHENRVYLTGNVKHPGSFGSTDTMRISNLVDGGAQLKENSFTSRADLYRTNSDGTKTLLPIALDRALSGDPDNNIMLEPFDSLVIYSFDNVTRRKFVMISGEVKKPGRYLLYDKMKLSDLVFLAGNLTKQAYLLKCEIARVNDGRKTDILTASLEDIFAGESLGTDILLQEDDCVFVRQLPDWRPTQIVIIEGEVLFPGSYAIRHKNERLSDLIARAGGLTASAFPEGALYYRRTIEGDVTRRNIGQIISNTQELRLDSLGNQVDDMAIKFNPGLLNRIIIELPNILQNPGDPDNIVLADSDYVYIPTFPSGVQVIGAVAANGTISFVHGKRARFYIEQAGGITPDGVRSEIRLVKPNGKVLYKNRAWNQKIDPGDAIVVPSKIKKPTDWTRVLMTTATVVGTMATTILVVDRLK